MQHPRKGGHLDCILRADDRGDHPEVGFRLHRTHHPCKEGTEGVRALLEGVSMY